MGGGCEEKKKAIYHAKYLYLRLLKSSNTNVLSPGLSSTSEPLPSVDVILDTISAILDTNSPVIPRDLSLILLA